MANPIQNPAFQNYNSQHYQNRPASKKPSPLSLPSEPLVFGRIPYSSIKRTDETSPRIPPPPTSPIFLSMSPRSPSKDSGNGTTPWTSKRRLSTASLGNLLPSRKGSPMTALAAKRQNLWMSIAKNPEAQNSELTSIPLQRETEPPSLLRKKILRLLLVFSYLLSISLFAIALATFYGFFWSGYDTNVAQTSTTIFVSSTANSTVIDIGDSLDTVSVLSSLHMRLTTFSLFFICYSSRI